METRREFSKRTKLDAFARSGGRCQGCMARLYPGKYEFHHQTECTFGGKASLENAVVLCVACHAAITRKRAAVIAKSNRVREKHLGIRRPGKFRGWRKFNGDVVWAK
jgi:5-methylcytosine-specific restriction enzyme A